MKRTVTFKGSPLTLAGRAVSVGEEALDFHVVAHDLKAVSLADFKDKIKVITTFPSIDTPVCDLQVKEFNKQATGFSPDVVVIGISKDLPFAQKRFCDTYAINNVVVLSDYKTTSFGINYGVLIKELNLLARTVMLVDKNNVVRYSQIVSELTQGPDFAEALKKLVDVVKNPTVRATIKGPHHCTPCEGVVAPLPKETVTKLAAQLSTWQLVDDKKIVKEFTFTDFAEAKYFLDVVSVIADEQGHHPTMTLAYAKLKITLSTHAAGGLTDNDFIMARMIDALGS